MICYFIFLFSFFLSLKKQSKYAQLAIGWVIIANVVLCFPKNSYIFLLGNKMFMAEYAHMFFIGGFICNLQKEKTKVLDIVGMLLCILTQFRVFPLQYGLFFFVSSGLLVIFTAKEKAGTSAVCELKCISKPLLFFAAISYPLYLIHQNIGYAILINLYRAGIRNEVIIFIPMIVLSLLAYLMHRIIEEPLIKKKGKKNRYDTQCSYENKKQVN